MGLGRKVAIFDWECGNVAEIRPLEKGRKSPANIWSEPASSSILCVCKRESKALTRLSVCPGSPEPLLLANAISTKILCVGPYFQREIKEISPFLLKIIKKVYFP